MRNFGQDLGIQQIDPFKIKFADETITEAKPFRNPRSHLNPEEMANKRKSIQEIGLLKHPIIRPIQNDPDGFEYQMIAGSLRLRSILKLIEDNVDCYNPETVETQPANIVYRFVKCQVRVCDEETAIRISIAENLEHTQVPELDLMEYCQELVDLKNQNGTAKYTKKQVAELCNRSESWVSLTLQLNELEPAYKKLMNEGRLSRTGAINMMLGTTKENFGKVIDECKKVVEKEAIEEEKEAIEEEKVALTALEDAEIDMGIHAMQKNDMALEAAKKRKTSASKRVSVASEKRATAQKKAKEGAITADTVNQVILSIPGAKKGKSKPLTAKNLKTIQNNFTSFKPNEREDRLAANVAVAVIDLVLGGRPTEDLEQLIASEKSKLEPAEQTFSEAG